MAYRHGQFVWCELVTSKPDDGIAFWTEVAGFGVKSMKMPGGADYRVLDRAGRTVAGVVAAQQGASPHFTQYVSVADVAASAQQAVARGGRVLVPPTDIGLGVFATIADPQGATFQLWRGAESDEQGALAVCWNELWARDAEAVRAFYEGVLGWASASMPMPQGAYFVFKSGETSVAGLMNAPDPAVPPMWLPYLEVDDCDAVVARARQHGGTVHAEPMSMEGIGRFAILADRQGASAGVIKPA